ncbi:hypothetical protein [Streptomyces sp. NBC_01803]|uniref:hypothetical protein n=1 Tax=Streptomyces sp. NBC_01803 TaxID=2975946 RepID=UPI002DDAACD3|nr:hypothetical protein [Streptomyces sp. NBC_01803]WSA45819.1 hypothetical protein OIE51_17390 [Streptomyces sp. NBC_01803]
MARPTPASGSGAVVTGLTVAALAVVAFFAYQASAADDGPRAAEPPAASSPADGSGGADGGTGGTDGETEGPPAVPAESGRGKRVVYALGQQRVWLVDTAEDGSGEVVTETYEVFPSPVRPPVGEYAVSSRAAQGTGSDGVAIEHAVVFHVAGDGTVFGFSAALDGSTPDPGAEQRTGGVRQSRRDGDAMWLFATAGVPVVVVP